MEKDLLGLKGGTTRGLLAVFAMLYMVFIVGYNTYAQASGKPIVEWNNAGTEYAIGYILYYFGLRTPTPGQEAKTGLFRKMFGTTDPTEISVETPKTSVTVPVTGSQAPDAVISVNTPNSEASDAGEWGEGDQTAVLEPENPAAPEYEDDDVRDRLAAA